MRLASNDFADGGKIPRACTCDGEDLSPALSWSGSPAEAGCFALLCNDPDAPVGIWRHWAVYDMPGGVAALPRGAGRPAGSQTFKQAINDFRSAGYGGPCPSRGHGGHHCRFLLLALSVERVPVPSGARCLDVERAAFKHALAEALLVGTYVR